MHLGKNGQHLLTKKLSPLILMVLMTMLGGITPLKAVEELKKSDRSATPTQPIAQTPLTRQQVLNACVQNRAETLPNPFVDVPENHWAYRAVLTLYYCGPDRQATPPALIERLIQETPDT